MKVNTISSALLFAAVAHANSHGAAHKARSNAHVADSILTALFNRDVDPSACNKGAMIDKLLKIVPTSLVSAMVAQPTPFTNDNPPEFWSKLSDDEKNCLAELWPVDKESETYGAPAQATAVNVNSVHEKSTSSASPAQATTVNVNNASTVEECTTTIMTSTITRTFTITIPTTPTGTTSAVSASDPADYCEETTTTSTITQTRTITVQPAPTETPDGGLDTTSPVDASPLPTSSIVASVTISSSSSASKVWASILPTEPSKTAPYGNGTTPHHHAPTASGTGAGNSSDPGMPEFMGGQGALSVGFFSSALAAVVAVAFGFLA
jgi:hypothetical protein